MGDTAARYTTQDLTVQTLPDFQRLFTGGNGWDSCWCTVMQRTGPVTATCRTRAERNDHNRREKLALVRDGRAHGVLVYADAEPVGWCQYGPPDELPVLDRPRSRFAKPRDDHMPPEDWRVTCFVVAKRSRRQGVATTALLAALEAIRGRGGGIVEGYPLDPATRDRWTGGTWSNFGHLGTVPMFETAGFTRVGWLRSTNAIMRRTVRARRT